MYQNIISCNSPKAHSPVSPLLARVLLLFPCLFDDSPQAAMCRHHTWTSLLDSLFFLYHVFCVSLMVLAILKCNNKFVLLVLIFLTRL